MPVPYFIIYFGNNFSPGILTVYGVFGTNNRNIPIAVGQFMLHVSCSLGCEQKGFLIESQSTLSSFHSTHISICKVSFYVV